MTVLVLLVLCDRVWQESSEELTKMKGSETRVDIFCKQSCKLAARRTASHSEAFYFCLFSLLLLAFLII